MEGFKYNVQPGRYRHFKGNEYQTVERDGKVQPRFVRIGD